MPQTLREKTTEARRRHVLEAAVRVFAERGFRGTTIRDVAREAGVSDGTIYNVFENKAALLHSLLDPLAETSPEKTGPPPSDDAGKFLQDMFERRWGSITPEALAMLRAVLAEALVDADFRAKVLERIVGPPIALGEPLIAAGVAQGRFASCDAALTIRALAALLLGLVMLRLLGEPEIERRAGDIPSLLASLLAEGLRPRAPETPAAGAPTP